MNDPMGRPAKRARAAFGYADGGFNWRSAPIWDQWPRAVGGLDVMTGQSG
jgi:hypothetical protein